MQNTSFRASPCISHLSLVHVHQVEKMSDGKGHDPSVSNSRGTACACRSSRKCVSLPRSLRFHPQPQPTPLALTNGAGPLTKLNSNPEFRIRVPILLKETLRILHFGVCALRYVLCVECCMHTLCFVHCALHSTRSTVCLEHPYAFVINWFHATIPSTVEYQVDQASSHGR